MYGCQAARAPSSDKPIGWEAEEPGVPGQQTGDLTESWSHHNSVKIKSPLLNVSISENWPILPKLCFIENFTAASSFCVIHISHVLACSLVHSYIEVTMINKRELKEGYCGKALYKS